MKLSERLKIFRVSAAWPDISLDEFEQQMDAAFSGSKTRSGVVMSERLAMTLSAVFNAVTLISGSIASCKLILYQRLDEQSRERLRDHPLFRILHGRVNPYMTSFQWIRTTVAHLLLWGNAYSIVSRDPYRGTIIRIERLLRPDQVRVFRLPTGELQYLVTLEAGTTGIPMSRQQILHIPGLGFNGVTGFSVITLARESFGLTAASEEFGQRFFGQGVNAGGFLERPVDAPKFQTDEARVRFTESIAASYSGPKNQGKYILLEEGTKFNKNVIPLEDAQFLTTRTFQIDEVARWFNMPPHKLKELSRATFSNIEHQQIEYITDTLQPWCELIESEINSQLVEEDLQETVFAEFLMDSLLRGDAVSRSNALAVQRQWGIINADEWRAKENMNPQPDGVGQKYLVPTNYTVADKIGEPIPATAPPPPPADPATATADAELAEIRGEQRQLRQDFEAASRAEKAATPLQITVEGSTHHFTVDGKTGKVKRTTTVHHDDKGRLVASETVEEPVNG